MLIKNENRIYATPAVKGLISLYTWHNSSGWFLFKPRINLSPFLTFNVFYSVYIITHQTHNVCSNVGLMLAHRLRRWSNVGLMFILFSAGLFVCIFRHLKLKLSASNGDFLYIFDEKIALLIYFRVISKIIAVEETYPFLISTHLKLCLASETQLQVGEN